MDKAVEQMYEFTSMGRMIDPRYPSNRFILITAPLSALIAAGVAFFLQGSGPLEALITAVLTALVVGVAWALGREYDPDQPAASYAAAVLALVGALVFGPEGLLPAFLLIGYSRLVNHTTGLAPQASDVLLIVLGTAVVVFFTEMGFLFVVGAVAFAIDGSLEGGSRFSLLAAGGLLVGLGATIILNGLPPLALDSFSLVWWAGMIATLGLFGLGIATPQHVEAVGDATQDPLNLTRVRLGMAMGLLMALLSMWGGQAGVISTLPVWATLLGTGIVRLRAVVGHKDPT